MKKITLIEDDVFIQDFVSQKLLDAGYEVTVCLDGAEAIDHIEENQPDVVLLDLDLPNVTGQEILAELRESEETKLLPVIIFTNHDDTELREHMMEAGANDFYMKAATDPVELIAKIEAQL